MKVELLTELWYQGLGVALGSIAVEATDLIEEFGPVRDGFLDRTGFERLYAASKEETGLSLAESAIADSHVESWGSSVDALIYVTSTGDLVAPGNAHLLQHRLGLPHQVLVLDLNDACTGFVRALHLAHSLIQSGAASVALVVLSDTYSKLYAKGNLKVSPLFSDGASAFLVSAERQAVGPNLPNPRHWRILSQNFLSDGGQSAQLSISRGEEDLPLGALEMNGAGVFNFVLNHLADCVTALTTSAGISAADVDQWYVHQGSRAVVTAAEKALGAEPGSLFRAASYGNVVGSSLPFQLDTDSDRADETEVIALLAFGVGLTIAGMLIAQSPSD